MHLIQGHHIPLFLIHPPIPPLFTLLPHLSGVKPEIQHLPLNQGGGEDLTSVLQHLKVSRCGLVGVWDTNALLLHILGFMIVDVL